MRRAGFPLGSCSGTCPSSASPAAGFSTVVCFSRMLQSEENKTLLSQALAGTVKNKSGVRMTGRHKDNSPVQLLVALGESWVGRQRSIMCLLQPASSPVAAMEEVSLRAVDAKSAPAELTPRVVRDQTTSQE